VRVEDMAIVGFRLFCGGDGLIFFNLDNTPLMAAPTAVASVGNVTCLDVAGEYVYAGVYIPEPSVVIVEAYNENTVVGSCAPWMAETLWDLVVYGHYVYTMDCFDIYIIDVSDPTNPVHVGSAWAPGDLRSLAISGHYLFVVATWDTYVLVYDISDPENPVLIGQNEHFGDMYRVAVSGDYLYGSRFGGFLSVQVFQRRFDRESNQRYSPIPTRTSSK
jgi:hypothetical protein